MDDMNALLGRIDAEFARAKTKVEELRKRGLEEYQGRQDRLKLFQAACEKLKEVWTPRLEALKRAFGDQVSLTPRVEAGRREATFSFNSDLARITLSFSAATDPDVRTLALAYSLEILPMLMSYPDKSRLEQPLDRVDPAAVGAWIDDRVVDFVKTYLSLQENEFYLKPHMVEDPVAHVRFPEYAAAATLERGGKTLYFIANQTRQEFEAKEARQAG